MLKLLKGHEINANYSIILYLSVRTTDNNRDSTELDDFTLSMQFHAKELVDGEDLFELNFSTKRNLEARTFIHLIMLKSCRPISTLIVCLFQEISLRLFDTFSTSSLFCL